jgi:hypothetical protein
LAGPGDPCLGGHLRLDEPVLGGRGAVGGDTLGVEIDRLAHERGPAFVGALWAAVALKAIAAGRALALVESWGRRLPRRLLLVIGGVTGAAITPNGLGAHAVSWHLALWDPFWLVGGILFLAATRAFQLSPRAAEGG